MHFGLLLLAYFLTSTPYLCSGLVMKSTLGGATPLRSVGVDRHLEKNGYTNGLLPHRFRLPEPTVAETGDASSELQSEQEYSSSQEQEKIVSSSSREEYFFEPEVKTQAKIRSGEERSDSDSDSVETRDDDVFMEKDTFKIPLWEHYFLRTQHLNGNINSPEVESKDSQFKETPSGEPESQPRRFVEGERKTAENDKQKKLHASQQHPGDHPELPKKKKQSSHLTNFYKVDTDTDTRILIGKDEFVGPREEVPLPELGASLKFPENEIVSQVYSMIKSADNLGHRSRPQFYNVNQESLPEAQRRYASESFPSMDENSSSEVWMDKKWDFQRIHFTTITVGTLMLFLILVVMVLALRVHCRNREKTAQEWIRHPVVQPTTAASDAIQPTFHRFLHANHLQSEPIRIKAKGLLERRGSNTSLTIDLAPGSEGTNDVVFSPSRECTPEQYLMTAGNRLSRRQLRLCFKDTRDLHAEFWQISTNHPDKCSVPGAAAKNRYRTVLPNEDTRVVLHRAPPDSPESPASQYINANYVRGYDGEERAYIATQGPLAHTVEDLWLLALQERAPAIVMITRLKEKGRVKCEPYVPSYSATYGSIQITVKQVVQKNGYTIRQIHLKRGDEVHTTLHFWFTSWPDHKTPSSARHLIAMATEVDLAKKENRGPVIVHCSAGIGRTGCFIAVSIGKAQLLEEDCIDILGIVCQMRLDRGGMVQTAEQYEFIHRALALSEASLPSTD